MHPTVALAAPPIEHRAFITAQFQSLSCCLAPGDSRVHIVLFYTCPETDTRACTLTYVQKDPKG